MFPFNVTFKQFFPPVFMSCNNFWLPRHNIFVNRKTIVVRICPVKFQNRERGIEFCRSRKIMNSVFIQGQVRLRHFLGRALRPRVRLSYDTFWAERCGQDRLGGRALQPHVLHLRPHQLQVSTQASHRYYFSGSTKFNPPLSVANVIQINLKRRFFQSYDGGCYLMLSQKLI